MYSNVKISDSTVTPKDYAERAQELGHGILSSCEHGYQGNYFSCVSTAKEYGLKPLIGAEAYWVKNRYDTDGNNCHIFIGAKNENGRQSLNNVLSEANLTGFYKQPRLDTSLILSLPKDDVIVTTACLDYWKYENAEEITALFANHFGKNFFLEVQYHNTPKQIKTNKRILKLHEELKIPLIMGCDSHYISLPQREIRTDFLASKKINYPDKKGCFLDYPDGDIAYERFAKQSVLGHQEICDAMDNTNVFLDIQEYDSPVFNSDIKVPSLYPNLSQNDKNNLYKNLVLGVWDNYKNKVPVDKWELYESEIRKEIKTVEDTNTADYFIDNYYIINKGKENGGWLTKTGRGSAVSFITNMLLGFTEVDRISAKIHMYPERFMSSTRILQSGSLPDIDFNCGNIEPFARAQQEILGEDHAYPMIAYGTMQKSAAWKLYAKSQGIPFNISNIISRQIKKYENAVNRVAEDEKKDINVLEYIDKEYHAVYQKSKDYLGLITSWSIAPCSYLLYQGSIRKEIGLIKIKDKVCCLMDGHWAEKCHFLKNDLLKVSVVDMIFRTFNKLGTPPLTVSELLALCPPNDKAWDIYEKGCTLGINQFEQSGTASRVTNYKPKNISELGAFVAAIRPGFKSMYKNFETRKPFSYGVATFDSLIQTDEMPNSFLLYQEQIMAALNYAGIDMADCYTAIKNIAKKRAELVFTYREKFVHGLNEILKKKENKSEKEALELSHKLWQIIEDSSQYSFNASHSYCVALDSLYGAWLKAHHPHEFYEALLIVTEEKGDKDRMRAIKKEAESYFGITFPPFRFGQDNRSIKALPENNMIVNSISAIKGFGVSIGAVLYECSKNKYTSFFDVLSYLDNNGVKASKVRPLITIDYFQDFGNINELLLLLDAWKLFHQGKAKSIRKDKEIHADIRYILDMKCVSKNKDGSDSASYKINGDAMNYLYDLEKYIKNTKPLPPSMKELISYSFKILGYVDVVTNKAEDRRRVLITDISPLHDYKNKVWAYRLGTRSLGTGKTARVTIKATVFDQSPLTVGDIVNVKGVHKNNSGYWYLISYDKEA